MRYILHIDMNAFFASVEEILNPKLKNLPIAVAGRTSRASVIASPNYIARKYGVKAAMPNFKAKKLCPNLIIVNHHFDEYHYLLYCWHLLDNAYDNLILVLVH